MAMLHHTLWKGTKSVSLLPDSRAGSHAVASTPAWSLRVLAVIVVLGLIASMPSASAGDETSWISAFVMGGRIWTNPFRILFMRDPIFRYAIFPTTPFLTQSDKEKLDRVYYPRTRDLLIRSYDLMVFHDLYGWQFTGRQVFDLDYAFRQAGMTAICGLAESWDHVWQPTILADLLPVSEHRSVQAFVNRPYWVKFRTERDRVFLPFVDLGIEKAFGNNYCLMTARQGTTIWGDIKPAEIPWMVSWRPGGSNAGMQWIVSHTFDPWWAEENNPYALDVATNMVFYSLGRPLISDIRARREARRLFANVQTQKSLMLSMVEWADNFGANVDYISDRLKDLEGETAAARQHYLEQDYLSAISFLDSLSGAVSEIAADAARFKDQALFWVYAFEWLVVTATALLAGVSVWALMVRRGMYRVSDTTRLKRAY